MAAATRETAAAGSTENSGQNGARLPARIACIDGRRAEQELGEHCRNTAEYAARSLEGLGLHDMARLAGLIHDMGKARGKFAEYINDAYDGKPVRRGSVNHTFTSVAYIFEKCHGDDADKWDRLACEMAAFAAGAHHGLFDCMSPDGESGFGHRLKADRDGLGYDEAVRNFLGEIAAEDEIDRLFAGARQEARAFFEEAMAEYRGEADAGEKAFFHAGLMARLMLSAVISGDRKDACRFAVQGSGSADDEKPEDADGLRAAWEGRLRFCEERISAIGGDDAVSLARAEVSAQCRAAAGREPGIYRLAAPAGSGKTLGSLRFALAHAAAYKKRRVIFITPLLNVLDQNAKAIKSCLPDPGEALEHHSNAIRDDGDGGSYAAESWDSPIVISTLVQLLDILFSGNTGAIGRMQALCNSVLVIDEVQSVPKRDAAMFCAAMNFLARHCGTTVILSSATMPCLDELEWPVHLAADPDIVKLRPEQEEAFRRADIIDMTDPYGMDMEGLAGFCAGLMGGCRSLLAICNTRAEARELFGMLRGQAEAMGWDAFHLSASMCQAHRMDVTDAMKESLGALLGRPGMPGSPKGVLCVATQVAEAGMDLSFGCVVRIMAGLDSLEQAAGRCNRAGEYGERGSVFLVSLKDERLGPLKDIRDAQRCAREALALRKGMPGAPMAGGDAVREYYRLLYGDAGGELKYPVRDARGRTECCLADLLGNAVAAPAGCGRQVLRQPFRTIGEKFRAIDGHAADVIVPYGDGKDLIGELEAMEGSVPGPWELRILSRRAGPYTAGLYEWQLESLRQAGMVRELLGGRFLAADPRAYDCASCGLLMDAGEGGPDAGAPG